VTRTDLSTPAGEKYLFEEYGRKERSIHDIAKELGTYPNAIRRALVRLGIERRDPSAAQRLALKSGRSKHPTKGTRRSEATRIAISESVARTWRELTSTERQQRVEAGRRQWEEMSTAAREALQRAAGDGVRRAAVEGSKLEKFLVKELLTRSYAVEFHREGLLSSGMHVDLWLPKLKVAIEIDGPAHFLPIWGEENLTKHILLDQRKTGLLLGAGFRVVRVKVVASNVSEFQQRKLLDEILTALSSEEKFTQLEVA
jgi:very-short-patch-repair endonuclease